MLEGRSVHVEVELSNVQIVKKSYALYRIDLKITRSDGGTSLYHSFRRFSDFVKLKKDLEQEVGSELPYELPPRRFNKWMRPSGSCDPDVIEERVKELSTFLHDLLNDSFDTRWKKSPYVCHFLQIPSDWDEVKTKNGALGSASGASVPPNDLANPQKWLEELRNCKLLLEESAQGHTSVTRTGMQVRLRIQNLKIGLERIQAEQLVGASEVDRRWNLLNSLKTDLNRSSSAERPMEEGPPLEEPFSSSQSQPQKPVAGRKLGETSQTMKLNDQELLQLHKETTQQQDQDLEQLRKIILSQKELSLTMNQELAQQNELLDLMGGEVESTANKLRMANRNAKRFNDS